MIDYLKKQYVNAKSVLESERMKYEKAIADHISAGGKDFQYWPKEIAYQDARRRLESLATQIAEELIR